ncbi:separin protein [Coemansia sp. RSA 988]|nr:separin protein [Coemansia sp. RSA 988]
MASGFFRGTNIEQDQRFGDASKKLLKQMSFSSELKKPVDMSKVNMDAIKPWISTKINELIGIEDDVLQEYVVNMLEETESPDARIIQVNLTGFLEDKTQEFMQSLWSVLLEAQKSNGGVPESFIQDKIEELKKRRDEQDRAVAGIRASNNRLQEQTSRPRTTRSGRRSRWDSPAAPVVDSIDGYNLHKSGHLETTKNTRTGQAKKGGTDNREQVENSSSHSRQHDFTKCSEAVEQQVLGRLTTSSSKKPARSDIEFALALVNQANQLFSKKAADIHRLLEHKEVHAGVVCIERMMRVTLAAFQYLREHRSQAGFSALALEKTLSNFMTACTNAHLSMRIWDGLMLLRAILLEHAEAHIVASGSGNRKGPAATQMKAPVGRSVRRPAPRLKKGEATKVTATKQKGRAGTSTEHIAKGMHRLSISGHANHTQNVPQTHFPIQYCQSDLAFNILVTTVLCNILRVLAQSLASDQAKNAIGDLERQPNSALEWCLRTRELDHESIEPFLSVCFRAYYTLGGIGDRPLLGIRLLAITAYSNTKKCDLRELLKYACRAAARAESTPVANADRSMMYGVVNRYYTQILELVNAQIESAAASPELVEFIRHMAELRRRAGDISGSLAACRLATSAVVWKTISSGLVGDCLIRYSLDNCQLHPELESTYGGLEILANTALAGDARYTLTEWNALILCADIIRKSAKSAQLELRQDKTGSAHIGIYEALVAALDFAGRIYDAYISRGAAAKAESAGGTGTDVLFNHSAEVSLVLIQLVLNHQDSSVWMHANATSHSSRILAMCMDQKCSIDYLRNHSVLFYNYGAGLYQLKIYAQAANAIELAIKSLSNWISMAKSKSMSLGNSTEQLCKRFEIAALAYQSDRSYTQASRVYGLAITWILEHNLSMTNSMLHTDTNQTPLPPSSSVWSVNPLMVHLMQLVDRYVRMCAGRLLKDSHENQAFRSLQEHMDTLPDDLIVRGWLSEVEAFFWRPYIAPSSRFAFSAQKARLCEAVKSYKGASLLGHARCLAELAKIARDLGEMDTFRDNIDAAMELAKDRADENIYTIGIIAECFAWQTVAHIEHDGHADDKIAACGRLWALIYKHISSSGSGSVQKIDSGFLRDVVDLIQRVAELLLSRRLYSSGGDMLLVAFQLSSACDRDDRSWAPVVMECLIGLGTTSLLCGKPDTAARYFCEAAARYESGVLPAHVEISSKIAYASFQLACGDSSGGSESMRQASELAQGSLDVLSVAGMARPGRGTTKPETMVLLSKAAHTYSVLALKQGALADSVDLGVHSYRVLGSLLRSLTLAHKRAIQEQNRSHVQTEDDPFSDTKPATSTGEAPEVSDESKNDAEYIAYSGNWELQRLLIDVLGHLAEVYSIRGSTKESEYFLKKALDLSGQLQAPHQESYLRLREADILSRKNLWDECATALQAVRDKAKPDAQLAGERGVVDVVGALLIEGDAWRRCGNYHQAQAVYTQAMSVVQQMDSVGSGSEQWTISRNSDWGCPQLQHILGRITPIKPPQRQTGDISNDSTDSALTLPVTVMREDITIRQQLLAVLEELVDETHMQMDNALVEMKEPSAGRSVDQQPNHLLLQAKLAFFELQRMLTVDESWGLVLKSALILPALQLSRIQKPRKGTARARVKTALVDLEVLLLRAVATAITIGSAHSVHEASHLLALVKTMCATFGLISSASDAASSGRVLSGVVDDCRNITVMREVIDAMRRRSERMPPKLTVWPGDIAQHGKGGSDDTRCSSPMFMRNGPGGSPSLRACNLNCRFDGSPRMPEYSLGGMSLCGDDLEEGGVGASARSKSGTRLQNVVDGTQVVAGWEAAVTSGEHALAAILPFNWVVCGLSIDYARNVLFVTRYHAGQEPLVLCLPMRSVNVIASNATDPVPEIDMSTNESMFESAHQILRGIIADSDKTMKTGSTCTTDAEKRAWWEQRALLDCQLGKLLASIEDEWLGGFRYVLEPQNILSAGVDKDMLRKDIEKSLVASLPKSYATKAKSMELTSELCMVVLHVARRTKCRSDTHSEDDSADNDWLDMCSLLWDIYFYQGAAPPSNEAALSVFADRLGAAVQDFVEPDSVAIVDPKSGRPHLILVLDKHAQQIPWECMPCIRDYPVSRVPSISFLKERILTMKATPISNNSSSGELDLPLSMLSRSPPSSASRHKGGRQSPDTLIPGSSLLSSLTFDNAAPGNCADNDAVSGVHVNGKHAFFVLNPEGDLHRTQANFETYLRSAAGWNGVVGRRPMDNECEHGLSSSDIFLYFGHGGAESYISRSQIRALDRCAVVLLLGCSSGQLKLAGEYDALGTATDYLVGGCPALVGNLWDVGDKDIDRFAASMLHVWGLDQYSAESIAVKLDRESSQYPPDQPVSLAEAVCLARKACRMSYLTGAAPVVYGIPAYLT